MATHYATVAKTLQELFQMAYTHFIPRGISGWRPNISRLPSTDHRADVRRSASSTVRPFYRHENSSQWAVQVLLRNVADVPYTPRFRRAMQRAHEKGRAISHPPQFHIEHLW